MNETQPVSTTGTTRRQFVQTGTAAVAASAALSIERTAWAAGSDELKIGLVGCGGRGSGAATQALSTGIEGVRLHAVADAFKEKAEGALSNLRTNFADKVDVPEERIFSGLNAYEDVINNCDLVMLATPPGRRIRKV